MSTKKGFSGKITKTRAIKIFEALGFKTACKWNAKKLEGKIESIRRLAEGAELEPKMQKWVNAIIKALKDGRKVSVIDIEDVEDAKLRDRAIKDAEKRAVERKSEDVDKKVKKAKRTERKAAKKEKAEKQAKEAVVAGKEKKKRVRTGITKLTTKMLQNGPVLEKDIVAKIVKKFPDVQEKTIKSSVGWIIWSLKKAGKIRKKDKKYKMVK